MFATLLFTGTWLQMCPHRWWWWIPSCFLVLFPQQDLNIEKRKPLWNRLVSLRMMDNRKCQLSSVKPRYCCSIPQANTTTVASVWSTSYCTYTMLHPSCTSYTSVIVGIFPRWLRDRSSWMAWLFWLSSRRAGCAWGARVVVFRAARVGGYHDISWCYNTPAARSVLDLQSSWSILRCWTKRPHPFGFLDFTSLMVSSPTFHLWIHHMGIRNGLWCLIIG